MFSHPTLGLPHHALVTRKTKENRRVRPQASWSFLAAGTLHTFIVQSPHENLPFFIFSMTTPDTVTMLHSTPCNVLDHVLFFLVFHYVCQSLSHLCCLSWTLQSQYLSQTCLLFFLISSYVFGKNCILHYFVTHVFWLPLSRVNPCLLYNSAI